MLDRDELERQQDIETEIDAAAVHVLVFFLVEPTHLDVLALGLKPLDRFEQGEQALGRTRVEVVQLEVQREWLTVFLQVRGEFILDFLIERQGIFRVGLTGEFQHAAGGVERHTRRGRGGFDLELHGEGEWLGDLVATAVPADPGGKAL